MSGAPRTFAQYAAAFLAPPILVTSVALLVKGYAGPGDGFSGGVVAATGLLFHRLAFGPESLERIAARRTWMATALAGLVLALVVVLGPAVAGRALVSHFPGPGQPGASIGSIELHTALLFDVGVYLVVVGSVVTVIDAFGSTGKDAGG
jgi:multisubunit Na+/H+ antiporter MnhB subunit